MNMKKIIAGVAASALAVSALAVSAFAKITNANGADYGQAGKYVYEAQKDLGDKLGDCYGVIVSITVDDAVFAEKGCGGGICANNDPFTWVEFGNEGSEKPIITDGKTIKYTVDKPLFEKGEDSQLVLEGWWGSDFSVDGVVYLDKDGNDLLGAAPTTTAAATEAPAGTTAAGTQKPAGNTDVKDPAKGDAPNTGIEGVAVVAGLAVLATGAIVVAKKRK